MNRWGRRWMVEWEEVIDPLVRCWCPMAVKDYCSKFYRINYDNLPIPMTSVDVIPRTLNVKVALRNFGLLAILYRRRADCVLTSSVFRWPRYPHPYWAPCYCLCNGEMGQILAPWWLTIFRLNSLTKLL